jgi:hypothetical protein
VSGNIRNIFKNKSLSSFADIKKGLSTGNVDVFTRLWYEVELKKLEFSCKNRSETNNLNKKWFPYMKGGAYRKWYGNKDYIVNWENDGDKIKNFVDNNGKQRSRPQNLNYYFLRGLTYSAITSYKFSVRYMDKSIFGGGGDAIFIKNPNCFMYVFALLNSELATKLLKIISPTMNFEVGHIINIPIVVQNSSENNFDKCIYQCIDISREEWDSRETSWDFKTNELLRHQTSSKLEDAYDSYCNYWRDKYFQLHKNEEELNRLFIDIYDLEDELTPDVPLEDITILKNETQIEDGKLVFNKDVIVKQFISYAVGCMFGRYSPHKEGLILANQGEGIQEFLEKVPDAEFLPDEDAIIPILDEEYFTDDIVGRFKEFLKVTFGPEKLSENMDFIAHSLSSKGKKKTKSSEQVIRNYFLKDFYKDHVKMYKKRPIYWLFSSGKKRAFNALVYMHRYDRTTLARMRTEYLLELEGKMDAHREMLSSEDARNAKEKAKLAGYIEEIMAYDEVLKNKADAYIEIDLDDGVKENYKLFDGLVGKI